MKFKKLFLFAAIALSASCGKYEFDASLVNQEVTNQNAKNQLGVEIDPNQNWRPIRQGNVTITANADLENIVRVEVLTESPFGNEDAMVLSSKECHKGDKVTLKYEAPDYLTHLVAACVNDQGVYYIRVFDINSQAVEFKTANARRRAGAEGTFPSTIILGESILSFNAQRAEESLKSEKKSIVISTNTNGSGSKSYTDWGDGSWINDRLWSHQSVEKVGGWDIKDGTIFRPVPESDPGELATVDSIVTHFIPKKNGGAKANNWKGVVEGNAQFKVNNNYIVSDGNPLILIPLEMNTSEGHYNSIYYYYYNPKNFPDGLPSAEYIKSLPKYKAIKGFKGDTRKPLFDRTEEYLLPYYGDESPVSGMWASPVIPKGYRIGFLNRKDFGNEGKISNCGSGCVYGDGRLNVEVNQLQGHYKSAITMSGGMDYDSPRIGIFAGNNRTYLCFEDGADCNFRDMIIEIKQGTEIIKESVAPEVDIATYTMCFEDRPQQADYDMNDVVLTAERYSDTQVKLTLLACGASDDVTLHGTHSPIFEGNEIHKILNLPEGQRFANTKIGSETVSGVFDIINIGDMSIEDFLAGIYIKNESTGYTVTMPETGESPYAIIVPMFFNYPKEGTNIKKAYPEFTNWVQDMNANKDWYRGLEGVDRFPTLILRNK